MKPTEFADLIHKAQEVREASWDGSKYLLSQETVARSVVIAAKVPLDWTGVITLLNTTAWNDVQKWANKAKDFTLADLESMEAARISYEGY